MQLFDRSQTEVPSILNRNRIGISRPFRTDRPDPTEAEKRGSLVVGRWSLVVPTVCDAQTAPPHHQPLKMNARQQRDAQH
jgi:hypothetical protein